MTCISKEEFKQYRQQFSLGNLTTESFHHLTLNLSDELETSLSKGLDSLQKVDEQALLKMKSYGNNIFELNQKIKQTLSSGNKIYISGCGATGRLAITLEFLYRKKFDTDQVISFMAGGDFALIKSVERFEDSKNYGERQLTNLGFKDGDFLIAITEGGETQFVINTALYAVKHSKAGASFVFCNPPHQLEHIERSQDVINCQKIKKYFLDIGPMAISGSTRMQATSAQMIFVGLALLEKFSNERDCQVHLEKFIQRHIYIKKELFEKFTKKEASIYDLGGHITYDVSPEIGLAVLTDTTERSPTFSLVGFENKDTDQPSMSFLTLKKFKNNHNAWKELLGREPRCLDWEDEPGISLEDLYGFDISQNSLKRRSILQYHQTFSIALNKDEITLSLDNISSSLSVKGFSLLDIHFTLKLILNTHSTAVMGLLGRYQGNMMTYVKPSNFKLIDRALRYIKEILKDTKNLPTEDELIDFIFEGMENPKAPIVKQVVDRVLNNRSKKV